MKIPGHPDMPVRLAAAEAARRAARFAGQQPAGRSAEAAGQDGDRVRLSDRARELSRLADMIDRLPDVRRELVDRFREEVSEGRYVIDTRKIADELFREVRLPQPRTGASPAS